MFTCITQQRCLRLRSSSAPFTWESFTCNPLPSASSIPYSSSPATSSEGVPARDLAHGHTDVAWSRCRLREIRFLTARAVHRIQRQRKRCLERPSRSGFRVSGHRLSLAKNEGGEEGTAWGGRERERDCWLEAVMPLRLDLNRRHVMGTKGQGHFWHKSTHIGSGFAPEKKSC
ncbi:hypothetical protein LZ32DRAFT_80145 [Colletotrichum eremochloae]|nr:hypothetical protein LZ32DRAFT_80145 [Colletotrichum eremochloae]